MKEKDFLRVKRFRQAHSDIEEVAQASDSTILSWINNIKCGYKKLNEKLGA